MDGTWNVRIVDEVRDWLVGLDADSYDQVMAAIALLAEEGPTLRRPYVAEILNPDIKNLKELRPGSVGRTEFRILFLFDKDRTAILLEAGDKTGEWKKWYVKAIKTANRRYSELLTGTRKSRAMPDPRRPH